MAGGEDALRADWGGSVCIAPLDSASAARRSCSNRVESGSGSALVYGGGGGSSSSSWTGLTMAGRVTEGAGAVAVDATVEVDGRRVAVEVVARMMPVGRTESDDAPVVLLAVRLIVRSSWPPGRTRDSGNPASRLTARKCCACWGSYTVVVSTKSLRHVRRTHLHLQQVQLVSDFRLVLAPCYLDLNVALDHGVDVSECVNQVKS